MLKPGRVGPADTVLPPLPPDADALGAVGPRATSPLTEPAPVGGVTPAVAAALDDDDAVPPVAGPPLLLPAYVVAVFCAVAPLVASGEEVEGEASCGLAVATGEGSVATAAPVGSTWRPGPPAGPTAGPSAVARAPEGGEGRLRVAEDDDAEVTLPGAAPLALMLLLLAVVDCEVEAEAAAVAVFG